MKEKQQPLLFVNLLLAAYCMGIVLAQKVVFAWGVLCIGAALLGAYGIFCLMRQSPRVSRAVLCMFFLLGILRADQSAVLPMSDISRFIGNTAQVSGMVVGAPRVEEDAEGVRLRYEVEVGEIRSAGAVQKTSGKVQAYVRQRKDAPIAQYGDRLRLRGEVKALHGYQNPGRIDAVASLKRQGITARLQAEKNSATVERVEKWFFGRTVAAVREKILGAMEKVMPQEDAAALFAMLFGGYGGIKPELLEAFTATGIVHILSVSGSHIALLAGTLQQLGALLRLRPAATALLIAAAVCFYAALSGFVPPVIRSAAMGILAFTALALERENDARRLLALTALAMLIFSPLLFYDISFQLSFGATAGLLYIAPVLRARMAWLPPWLAANVALTSAAQLSVLPVLAWYFNALSLSALLANLVAVPLVEAIIVCGLIGALLGLFLPILQNIFFILCSLTLGLVYNITSALAALPGSNLYLPSLHPALGAVYYGVLGVAVWALQDQSNAWLRFFRQHRKGLFALLVGVGLVCFAYGIRPSPVYVHFIDVGQGDAALVTTPHGKALLIDTGGVLGSMSDFDVGERVIAPYLRHYGVRQLEYLILTHAHEDHAGGAAAVCRRFPVGHVIVGREDRSAYARVFQTSLERLPDCVPAYAGQTWEVDGVRVAVLHAADASGSAAGNEVSNVISLSYGAHRFLITGDLDAAGEEALLFSGADVKSTVLKVGHHGSKTSSSEAFIRRVGARYAVISVGADNRFGHPNPAVVKRLEEGGARVYRTDKDGAVLCATDGRELKITTFAEDG